LTGAVNLRPIPDPGRCYTGTQERRNTVPERRVADFPCRTRSGGLQ
jgi:hypothetical protein